jgi:uncharacterized protein (TIGR02145 family)
VFLAFIPFINNAQTVTDLDGNAYHTVTIGTQVWMVENCKTTKYNDGSAIPLVEGNPAWANLTTPGYCWYDNDSTSYKSPYGALYNWFAANTGKLCPTGWHVPNYAEWTTLTAYLGGDSIAGGKLKETGTSHWQSPNTGATNESEFTAIPGGSRNFSGTFYLGRYGYFWSSSETGDPNLYYDSNRVGWGGHGSNDGLSVRCLSDYSSGINNMNPLYEIKINPNPAVDHITVELSIPMQCTILQIFDLMGNIVLQKQIEQKENVINISSLTKGMYIIKISDAQIILQKKLIKK